MCRHAAYIGPRTALAPVLTDLEHSLLHQSYRPRELLDGQTVNADGFGVAWYEPEVRPEPARLADPLPIWAAGDLPGFGAIVRAPVFLAAVRNGTVAGTNAASSNAPFVDGSWSWSLNGYLSDFPTVWRSTMLAEWMSPARAAEIRGVTDSEHLFQTFLTRLDDGLEPMEALRSVHRDVHAHAKETGSKVQLNLLASNGEHVFATRDGNQASTNSLYHVHDPADFMDAHLVASEPLMDADWTPVEPGTLLVLRDGSPPIRVQLHA